jgi:predicted dehydrogenase
MSKSKLKVAFVGAGGIARVCHLPAMKKIAGLEVVAVADTREETANQAAKEFSIPKVFTDYKDVLKLDDVDIIDICTPNYAHHPVANAALTAGKHVICEKPLAISVKQVQEMITASKKSKKKLMSIQNHRFRHETKKIKQMIEKGDVGELYYARAQAIRRRGIPCAATFIKKEIAGGGPMFDIGVHMLDLTYWLMGCPKIKTVTGVTATKLAKSNDIRGDWGEWDRNMYDVEDFAAGFIKLDNNAVISLEASFLLNMKDREIFSTSLFGTKGGLSIPAGAPSEIYTEQTGIHMTTQITQVPQNDAHYEQISGFIKSVRDNTEVPVPPEQSLQVIKMLESVYVSSDSGREVTF